MGAVRKAGAATALQGPCHNPSCATSEGILLAHSTFCLKSHARLSRPSPLPLVTPHSLTSIDTASPRTLCDSAPCLCSHQQIPGGPRIDGRVLVSGNSQYYVPFVTIRVSEVCCGPTPSLAREALCHDVARVSVSTTTCGNMVHVSGNKGPWEAGLRRFEHMQGLGAALLVSNL